MEGQSNEGIFWSKRPAEHQMGSQYRLVRTPAKAPLVFTILSHVHEGAPTHYFGGRTQPCLGAGCKACEFGRVAEWHGWVIALLDQSDEKAIVEFTPGPSEVFNAAFGKFRTLRGVRIKMFRPSGKSNGKIVAQVAEKQTESKLLPKVPELMPILMSIWRIKPEALTLPKTPRFLPEQNELFANNGHDLAHD